jgi:hypothetical protein
MIFVNGDLVQPWDPFCRSEKNTLALEPFAIPISMAGKQGVIKFRPFVLPTQSQFSSPSAHLRAGGPEKWNKQQGFYIYRAGRLLQSGGWCGLRTADEHSKLARVLIEIPAGFDDLFKVNISKMKINFPREIRQEVVLKLASVIKKANDLYRAHGHSSSSKEFAGESVEKNFEKLVGNHLAKLDTKWSLRPGTVRNVLPKLYDHATTSERRCLLRFVRRLVGEEKINEKSSA